MSQRRSLCRAEVKVETVQARKIRNIRSIRVPRNLGEAETHRVNFVSEESTAETEVGDAVKRRRSAVRSKEKEPRQETQMRRLRSEGKKTKREATETVEPRQSAEPEASAAVLNAALTLRRSFKLCIEYNCIVIMISYHTVAHRFPRSSTRLPHLAGLHQKGRVHSIFF